MDNKLMEEIGRKADNYAGSLLFADSLLNFRARNHFVAGYKAAMENKESAAISVSKNQDMADNKLKEEILLEKSVEQIWEDFWKGIVCNKDGSLNLNQVKRELADFHFVMGQVPKVYCHITGNNLSKIMYHADTVIAASDDYYNELIECEAKPPEDWKEKFETRFKNCIEKDVFTKDIYYTIKGTTLIEYIENNIISK